MIAKIAPAVSATPAPKATLPESNNNDFLATLEGKLQPKEEARPAAPAAPGNARPAPKDEKNAADETDAQANVEMPPLADAPLVELIVPPQVPNADGEGDKPADSSAAAAPNLPAAEAVQQQLQQLVAQVDARPALPVPAPVAPEADVTAQSTAVSAPMEDTGPMRSLMAASLTQTGPQTLSRKAHDVPDGDAEMAPDLAPRTSEPESEMRFPTLFKSQLAEPSVQAPVAESRFASSPEMALRPTIAVGNDHGLSRTPELSPPPATTLAPPVGTPAWQQALGHQLAYFSRNGVHNAELRLHPEELGSLQVNLRLNSDQAQLHFVTENHQVRAALEAAMPHLRTSLAESGIELGQSSVGSESPSSWQEAFRQEHAARQQFAEEGGDDSTPAGESHRPVVIQQRTITNGINTFI